MPIVYTIDPQRRLVDVKMTGAVTASEIAAYAAQLLSDPAYRMEYDTLTDMRQMSTVVCPEQLQEIARQKKAYLDRLIGTRRAVVASREATFAAMRDFEARTGGDASPFRVFRTMDEARAWLGLDQNGQRIEGARRCSS